MTEVLVAGVGNVFFGDDGFGVEVARQLGVAPPRGARVVDFGIRTLHLAYELIAPVDLCVVADCMPRGGAPGTLYVVEAEPAGSGIADAHRLELAAVMAAVRELGGRMPQLLVVGCEPATTAPRLGLSPEVAAAIPGALALIRELVATRTQEAS